MMEKIIKNSPGKVKFNKFYKVLPLQSLSIYINKSSKELN